MSRWVLPLALGTRPATYDYLRTIVGGGRSADFAERRPVPQFPAVPSTTDLRRAATEISQIAFRLSASGALAPSDDDAVLVAIAEEFMRDPDAWVKTRNARIMEERRRTAERAKAARIKREEVAAARKAARQARTKPMG